MLGLEQLSPEDRNVVARARRLERFLTQPFFTTEQFTGLKGKLVSLEDALDGCERILRDEFKDYPESALYMIGAIGEVKEFPHAGHDEEQGTRTVMAKLETGFLQRMARFPHDDDVTEKRRRRRAGIRRRNWRERPRKPAGSAQSPARGLVRSGHDGAHRLVGGCPHAARRRARHLARPTAPGRHPWTLCSLVAGLTSVA